MARYNLQPHPDHPPIAVRAVTVDLFRRTDTLTLVYDIDGCQRINCPEKTGSDRADDLWRTTCFELFLRFDDDERYVEFNFSPSTRWAAYAFEGYREGMTALDVTPPRIERTPQGVAVTLDLSALPRGELAMALTAVIEEEGGIKSYWSLAHPPGAPDFHHRACFTARLPAPDGA